MSFALAFGFVFVPVAQAFARVSSGCFLFRLLPASLISADGIRGPRMDSTQLCVPED